MNKLKALFAPLMNQPYLLLLLAPLFWGANINVGRAAVGNIDPLFLVLARWIGACLIVLPLAWPHLKKDGPAIRARLPLLAIYGVFGYAGFNLMTYGGVQFTTAVNASIEQASIPVMVFVGNFIFFAIRARWLQIAGVVLTIAGVVLTATHGEPARLLALEVNIGDAMVLLACLFYAVYSVLLRFKPDIHWLSFLAITFLFALAASVAAMWTVGGGTAGVARMISETTQAGWLMVLYVAIFPSILAQLFFARGVELIGANRGSLFINLLPVFGTLIAVIGMGEPFHAYHLLAAILVVGGIALSEWTVRRKGGIS